jgi:hypothetical protein
MNTARPIKCVETGINYCSIYEASKEYEVNTNTMRNIIDNPSKTIDNKHFISIKDNEKIIKTAFFNNKEISMEVKGKWGGRYPTEEYWKDTNILLGGKYKFFISNLEEKFTTFKLCLINPLRARKGNFYIEVSNNKIICQNHHVDVMKEHYPELYIDLVNYLQENNNIVKRSIQVGVLTSEEEHEILKEKAEKAFLSISAYVRYKTIYGD